MKTKSLVEYAASHKQRSCWVCSIPEKTEVEKGKLTHKLSYGEIARWLIDDPPEGKGYPAENQYAIENRIKRHMRHVEVKS